MRAVGFDRPGNPEVLHVVDIPEPHAGPGQVRISVKAAAVNPSDTVTRSGAMHDRYREVEPPCGGEVQRSLCTEGRRAVDPH